MKWSEVKWDGVEWSGKTDGGLFSSMLFGFFPPCMEGIPREGCLSWAVYSWKFCDEERGVGRRRKGTK